MALAAAVVVLCAGGCSVIVEAVAEAVTGEDVVIQGDHGRASTPRSIYLRGPVPGWEYTALRMTPYRTPPSLFQTDLFAGACPGLNLARGESGDPFAPLRPRADFALFDLAPSHAADVNYYRPGRVTLAGLADPFPTAPFGRMPAYGSGACTSVGIPLLTLGRPVHYRVLR
jgi:hypothetical protein